jgi:hypothetical protein
MFCNIVVVRFEMATANQGVIVDMSLTFWIILSREDQLHALSQCTNSFTQDLSPRVGYDKKRNIIKPGTDGTFPLPQNLTAVQEEKTDALPESAISLE